jgi:hypothetical protein
MDQRNKQRFSLRNITRQHFCFIFLFKDRWIDVEECDRLDGNVQSYYWLVMQRANPVRDFHSKLFNVRVKAWQSPVHNLLHPELIQRNTIQNRTRKRLHPAEMLHRLDLYLSKKTEVKYIRWYTLGIKSITMKYF